MTAGSSIRARLTLTITALTLIVGTLAVLVGLGSLENQIRDQAIEREVGDLTDLTLTDFGEPGLMLEDGSGGDGFFEWSLAISARRAVDELEALGLADVVFDAFADDDALHVLLLDGTVAVLERGDDDLDDIGTADLDDIGTADLDDIRILDLADIDDEVVVPQLDLEELVIVSFERFDTGPDPGAAARDLEPVVEEVDGLEIGLLVDLTDELDALDAVRLPLWAAAGALTLLAGLATWLLTGRALRPVAAITDRVAEITAGTLDGRVPESGSGDEIGVLAQTMNHMLARLERADLRRRQFVSDASHELRTPVAVLRSEAEVANRAPSTTTIERFASVVLGETARLEGLVEDLLSLARADERRSDATPSTSGLGEVDVDDVVLAEAARTRRLPVDRSQVSAGRVRGKADDLARTVGHLLDNAARHGDSVVAVGVRTEGDRVRIWIDDDGAGIAERDRDRVFERFTRLDEARTRDRGGSGLGLAVVAETVAGLGGTVTIDRAPLGGARVEIDLPAA